MGGFEDVLKNTVHDLAEGQENQPPAGSSSKRLAIAAAPVTPAVPFAEGAVIILPLLRAPCDDKSCNE